jgi:hypothetical protein
VLLIAVAAFVFGQEAAQGKLVTEIQGVVGKESAQAIQAMIEKTRAPALGLFAAVIGLMTLLVEATGVVMVAQLGRRLVEVPVGFKWLVDGLSDGSLDFGGKESAGACSNAWTARSGPRTRTGSSWVSWPRRSSESRPWSRRTLRGTHTRVRRAGLRTDRCAGHDGAKVGVKLPFSRAAARRSARWRHDLGNAYSGARQRKADPPTRQQTSRAGMYRVWCMRR